MKFVSKAQASAAWVQLGRPRVDLEQLQLGMEVEQEHTESLLDAAQIAVDHLDEFADYYTRLTIMEMRATRGMPPNGLMPNMPRSSVRQMFDMLLIILRYLYPDLGTLTLIEDEKAHDGGRHYAYCGKTDVGTVIAFASAANENLSTENLHAMMAHEMGHALDFQYGRTQLERRLGQALSTDDELRADQIAEAVFGLSINYDAKCAYLQTTEPGVHPRPKGLR